IHDPITVPEQRVRLTEGIARFVAAGAPAGDDRAGLRQLLRAAVEAPEPIGMDVAVSLLTGRVVLGRSRSDTVEIIALTAGVTATSLIEHPELRRRLPVTAAEHLCSSEADELRHWGTVLLASMGELALTRLEFRID